MEHFDIAVIGAGPGGYEAAVAAAKHGMRVVLIERDELGGTCLNRGCIPTKTLIHTAELYHSLQQRDRIGLCADSISCDMGKMQDRVQEVLQQLRSGIASLMKMNKVKVIRGSGRIEKNGKITISGEEPAEIEVDRILIATGSVPAVPPIPGHDLPGVMTSDEFLAKRETLEHFVIIGGGVIGVEFASLYASMGKKAVILEAMDRILANMDREISQSVKLVLQQRGTAVHAGAKVKSIEKFGNGLLCRYEEKGQEYTEEADGILIATGRRAQTEGLFGEGVYLAMERGHIVVNENYQTSEAKIYAIGDVIGGIQLAHMATAEGRNAIAFMLGEKPPIRTEAVPSCIYTSPEAASVGLTEAEAKEAGYSKVLKKKYLMTSNGKTVLSLGERGFIKIIADGETHKILGAQFFCERATDLVSELVMAVDFGLTLEDMASVIRPHPTFSEGITEAVL